VLGDVILIVVVGAASFGAGWVLRDAQARGIPRRKAYTWAALQTATRTAPRSGSSSRSRPT
jgi:hypothetical protein